MGALRRLKMNALDIKNERGRAKLNILLRTYKLISSIHIFKKKRPKRTRRLLKNKHICRMMHVKRNPVKINWKKKIQKHALLMKNADIKARDLYYKNKDKKKPLLKDGSYIMSPGHQRRFMPRVRG